MPQVKGLKKLSDDMSATYDGAIVVLYDTRGYSQKRITVMTPEEATVLLALYTDGCCTICLKEIPEGDVVCDGCMEEARNVRWLKR